MGDLRTDPTDPVGMSSPRRPFQVGTRAAMGLVGFVALALGAIRHPSGELAALVSAGSMLALLVGLVGAILRPRPAPGWLGFAVFGWGSLALVSLGTIPGLIPAPVLVPGESAMPTSPIVNAVVEALHPETTVPARPRLARLASPVETQSGYFWSDPSGPSGIVPLSPEDDAAYRSWNAACSRYSMNRNAWGPLLIQAYRITHDLLVVGFGLVGSVVGQILAARPRGEPR